MKRILIIKLWALGDILMATPLLTALKRQWPGCRVCWLVDAQNAALLEGHPLVDELIPLDTGAWRRLLRKGNLIAWLRQAHALRTQMKQRRFDAVINCHPDKWWSAFLCAAPVRVGLYPSKRLPLSRVLYTHALNQTAETHNTDNYLRTLTPLRIVGPQDRHMTLAVSEDARRAAWLFLAMQPGYNPAKSSIVLHPGTSQESKCWPAACYASLAALLAPRFNVIVTGSPKESALTRQIVSLMPPGASPLINAAGHLTRLPQTIALVAQAQAVVTGDTSVLHIASALQVPLVGIYGSTRPGDNAPLFGPHTLLYDDAVPCAPCYRVRCPLPRPDFMRCQHAVTPAQALQALDDLLSRSSPDTPTKASYEPSFPC